MIRTMFVTLIALTCAGTSTAAEKPPVIDPAGSYMLVEVGNLDNAILKGTSLPGDLTFAQYDAEKGDILDADQPPNKAAKNAASPRISTTKALVKSKASRLYLLKVSPGTWVIEGSSGTAFSLGSLSFPVGSRQIVDLGFFKPSVDWVGDEGPKGMMGGIMGAAFFGSMGPKEKRPVRLERRLRGPQDLSTQGLFPEDRLVQANFSDGVKFGNYLGGLVNRIGGRASREKAPGQEAGTPAIQ